MKQGLNSCGSLLNTLNHFGISFKAQSAPRDRYALLLLSGLVKDTGDNSAHFKTLNECFIRREGSF